MVALAVVVGVVVNGAGEILLARRAVHQHQGGLWEFPGGKLDVGEAPLAGLWRELEEELGIQVLKAEPLINIHHQYPDKAVVLDVYRVTHFDGSPQGREGQPLIWVKPSDLRRYNLPAANQPIVDALLLPPLLVISGAASSPAHWLQACSKVARSGALIIARPQDDAQRAWPWASLLAETFDLCRHNAARLVVHATLVPELLAGVDMPAPDELNERLQGVCHGVHLSAAAARKGCAPLFEGLILGASCHTAEELAQAASLNCQYALLSPVLPTQTHPDAAPLGWSEFARLCSGARLPVYALGGLDERHLPLAQSLGAQGVAAIRGLWPQ